MNNPWNDWLLAFSSLENQADSRKLEALLKQLIERVTALEKKVDETLNRR